MLLAKSCTKRNNIKNGTLMLGTLDHYRKTENLEIKDQEEGMLWFTVNFIGEQKLRKDWFQVLFEGLIPSSLSTPAFLGKTRQVMHQFHIVRFESDYVIVRNSSASIGREVCNSFIFCMSEVRKLPDARGIFKGYDDCWYIIRQTAHTLAMAIADSLLSKIKEKHAAGEYVIPHWMDVEQLIVSVDHDNVTYTDRVVTIVGDKSLTLDNLMSKLKSVAFIKPKKYSNEKEYRFQFTLFYKGTIVEPLVTSLIIQTPQNFLHKPLQAAQPEIFCQHNTYKL